MQLHELTLHRRVILIIFLLFFAFGPSQVSAKDVEITASNNKQFLDTLKAMASGKLIDNTIEDIDQYTPFTSLIEVANMRVIVENAIKGTQFTGAYDWAVYGDRLVAGIRAYDPEFEKSLDETRKALLSANVSQSDADAAVSKLKDKILKPHGIPFTNSETSLLVDQREIIMKQLTF